MAVTSQLSLQKNDWFFACKTNMAHRVGLVRFHANLGTWAALFKIYALRRAATLAKPLQPVWEKESTAPLYLTTKGELVLTDYWLKSRVHGPWHGHFVLDKLWPRNDTDDSATCIMMILLHANQGVRMGSEVSWIITSWAVTVKVPAWWFSFLSF